MLNLYICLFYFVGLTPDARKVFRTELVGRICLFFGLFAHFFLSTSAASVLYIDGGHFRTAIFNGIPSTCLFLLYCLINSPSRADEYRLLALSTDGQDKHIAAATESGRKVVKTARARVI